MFNKYYKKIENAWDKNIATRAKEIESGGDISYREIIIPWVIDKVKNYSSDNSTILDIGCGCGYLSNEIYNLGRKNIIGIDISQKSVDYSQNKYKHITFIKQDINSYNPNYKYNLCLAVMVANNLNKTDDLFLSFNRLLERNGIIIFIIPHPCFWPNKYILNKYDYLKHQNHKIEFSTKGNNKYPSYVYYNHNPISFYIKQITKNGYQIEEIDELDNNNSGYPDILAFVLKKVL